MIGWSAWTARSASIPTLPSSTSPPFCCLAPVDPSVGRTPSNYHPKLTSLLTKWRQTGSRSVRPAGRVLFTQATRKLVQATLPEGCRIRGVGQHSLSVVERPQPIYQLLPALRPAALQPTGATDQPRGVGSGAGGGGARGGVVGGLRAFCKVLAIMLVGGAIVHTAAAGSSA